jgi:asparagine synthase (glutamine-hydrolysing)
LPPRLRVSQPKLKLQKLAEILALEDGDLWLQLVSQNDPNGLTDFLEHALELPDLTCLGNDALARMQVCDTAFYLPDDILQKVDRAAMCVSLEVRPPLLDHRVVEFAFSLPRHLRWRDGQTKWMLRRLLERYVPRTLFERSKMGFAVPLQDWLKGPLREWAEDLLGSQQFGGGFLDAKAVQVLWREHLEGRANRAYQLWTILMFEAWRLRWHGGPALAPKASLA